MPSQSNTFNFVYGRRGTTYTISKVRPDGLVLPRIVNPNNITNPERAQVAFDSLESKLKYYTGNKWVTVDGSIKGKNIQSANGTTFVFRISHGFNAIPEYFNVIATSAAAANISFVTADNQFLYINYTVAPPSGTNNLSWNWMVQ